MSQPQPEGAPRLTSQRVQEMAYAFKQAGVLIGAIELGLFTEIAGGATTLPDIARALDMDEDRAERLLTTCVALGLLTKEGGRFANAPDVDRYLVRGRSGYFGEGLVNTAKGAYDSFKNVAAALRPPRKAYERTARDARAAREMTEAGYNYSIGAARRLAREWDLKGRRLLLDLGGGSGAYSIALVEANPQLHAIVLDYPTITVVAREFIDRAGLSDRISTHDADFSRDPPPGGADCILLSGNLQAYDAAEAAAIIARAAQVLAPGGVFTVSDYMLDDDRAGPLEPAFMNLGAVLGGPARRPGRVHSYAEVKEYMKRAGLVPEVAKVFIPGVLGRVSARKPS